MSLMNYKSKEMLVKNNDDIFLQMGKYIYETYGFKPLNKYYIVLKEQKRILVNIFLELTRNINSKDEEKINESFNKLNSVRDNIIEKIKFIDTKYFQNPLYLEIVLSFNKITKDDLIYTQNENMIISKVHLDFLRTIHKVGEYYNQINTKITSNMIFDNDHFTDIDLGDTKKPIDNKKPIVNKKPISNKKVYDGFVNPCAFALITGTKYFIDGFNVISGWCLASGDNKLKK